MKTDIEIAQSCALLPITAIGAKLGLTEEQLECYGRYKAKLLPSATAGKPQTGKLILVTAINPTAAGEGKTTTSIGLADSLSALGKKTVLALTQSVYGGRNVAYPEEADREIDRLTELGFGGLPVCVAKTQYSLSDDPTKLGAPQDFILTVRKVKVSAGAGFIVALTGDILTMPGLPKTPAAEAIDVDENGVISGLF